MKAAAAAHGIGDHSRSQVRQMALQDLCALEVDYISIFFFVPTMGRFFQDFISEKPFMFGDGFTELDCAVFSFVHLVFHHSANPASIYHGFATIFPKLEAFETRVRQRYFPEFEDEIKENV